MRAPFKKSTIQQVADLAGVSQSAVSHYINGRVNVCSRETGQRIRRAIEELHFTPSQPIRLQGTLATKTIGVCVSLPSEDDVVSSFTYLHRFWSGVGKVVDAMGYKITHYPRSMRDSVSCNPFLDGGIDGLLFSAYREDMRVFSLAEAGLPTVCVVRSTNLPEGVGSVVPDERDVVDLALKHLCNLGHRRIAYIGADDPGAEGVHLAPGLSWHSDTMISRSMAWQSWARRLRIEPRDYAVYNCGSGMMSAEDARRAVEHWLGLPSLPTAVFCGSDRLAISVMNAFKERGLSLPRDMSVVGVDNEGLAALFDPPLTSVEVPVAEVGQRATQMLIDAIQERALCKAVVVPVDKLWVRASTCPPRNKADTIGDGICTE